MAHGMLTPIDVLDVCALLLQRCGLSVAQLARHAGDKPAGAPADCATDNNHGRRITPRQAQVLALAQAAGGTNIAEIEQSLGIAMQTAFTHLDALVKARLVTKAKRPGRLGARYFARPADALDYVQAQDQAAAQPAEPATDPTPTDPMSERTEPQLVAIGEPIKSLAHKPGKQLRSFTGREDRSADAAPRKPRQDAEVIIPDHVKPQRAEPRMDTRYTVAPGEPLTGGFSATRPGVNPVTGRAWGT